MMEPEFAQRAVDFIAGGAYALEAHQERVGESIFLFAPKSYGVDRSPPEDVIKANVEEVKRNIGENSPANPPLLNSGQEESNETG